VFQSVHLYVYQLVHLKIMSRLHKIPSARWEISTDQEAVTVVFSHEGKHYSLCGTSIYGLNSFPPPTINEDKIEASHL